MSYETVKRMAEEIRTEIANGEELEAIKDRSGEFIDSWLPVYNNRIIEEWQSMPNEYDNRGSAELGHSGDRYYQLNDPNSMKRCKKWKKR
jgi:hypothetical protein